MTGVVEFPKPFPSMRCPECGEKMVAACRCNAGYIPAGEYAAQAVAKNPEKSNRAIAEEIGVDERTVRRARPPTAANAAVGPRIGLDGKVRVMPQAKVDTPEYTYTPRKKQDIPINEQTDQQSMSEYWRDPKSLTKAVKTTCDFIKGYEESMPKKVTIEYIEQLIDWAVSHFGKEQLEQLVERLTLHLEKLKRGGGRDKT